MNPATETRTYTVQGMTCDHCRAAVHEEVSALDGVSDVLVDLDSGTLEVRGGGADRAAVAAAVDEAGYELGARR
jgi:copper chaperone CopZ